MTQTIELSDGTTFKGTAGYTGQNLNLNLPFESVEEHIGDLINGRKTNTITFYYGAYKDVFHGFTQFVYINCRPDLNGEYVVCLAGEGTSVEHEIPTIPEEYLPKT